MRLNMAKSLVIYKSLSGFTKKYAEWIAQELQADLYDSKDFETGKFADYHVIVFGGSLHAVGISGVGIIKNNLHQLTDKNVIVFGVGASPPRESVLDEVKNKNFTAEQQQKIKFFYLRGGFDYDKLDLPNKFLMSLMKLRILMKTKKNRSSDEIGLLAAYQKPMDCTRKENIKTIVAYAQA
jgi:menaquinone-dependent protoporphyrinogen IX oxidase